jgi:CDP-glucose 4,6-dehydratase
MGTVNLFEAARLAKNLKVVINVTSDKCYQNNESNLPFEESDPMGGYDPYSASKGCAELITNAYRSSFFVKKYHDVAVSTVRAGNVIGGGDWSIDRIVPDFFRALESSEPLLIRNPDSIRPWQHVIEPLSGYLLLAEKMFMDSNRFSQSWNFGPNEIDAHSVKWLIDKLSKKWIDINIQFSDKESEELHEAKFLRLSINKVRSELGWTPNWSAFDAIDMINEFYTVYYAKRNILDLVVKQVKMYTSH